MRILLLNLPFYDKKLQRDLSCPHSSKADYYWPSIDLIAYSGIFNDQELFFIDGVQEKIRDDKLIKKIKEIDPEYIFTIISAISLENDVRIIKKIKEINNKIKIACSGDLCTFNPEKIKEIKEIDYIIQDFTEKNKIREIINNRKEKIISSSRENNFSLNIPRHELFKKYKYSMPYSYYTPVTGILTNYGCPFRCKFCNSNNLKFKSREIKEIIEELRYIEKNGIKEVYMRDLTFGVPQIEKILEEIIKSGIKIKWSCEFRVDLVNEKILDMMKKAGCFLIFYGGESGNQETLNFMNKGFKLKQMIEAINLTKKYGIETLVSFIVGFENEDEKAILKTKEFIMKLDPDFISLNVLVPRIGSKLREENSSQESRKLDNSEELGKKYPSGKYAYNYKQEIEREFFFRPKKLIRYLIISSKTGYRLKNFIFNGLSILSRVI